MDILKTVKNSVLETFATTVAAFSGAIEEGHLPDPQKYGDSLGFDVFASLYDREPKLRENAVEVNPKRAYLIRELHDLQSFQEVRERTVLLAPVAAPLVPYFCEQLRAIEKRMPEEPSPPSPEEGEDGIKRYQQERRQYTRALWEVRRNLMGMATRAKEALETAERLARMGWGREPGKFAAMLVNDRHLSAVYKAVAQVAEWFGRIQGAIAIAATKVIRRGVEIRGVTQGRDLSRLLPQELVKLSDPELEPLFLKDFLDGTLLQFDVEGKSPELKRGDAIILVDESGSMGGEPVAYAKAFAFVVRMKLKGEGRKCLIASFSHDKKDMRVLADEASEQEVVEWLRSYIGGGTNFDVPLRFAIREGDTLRQPDVIMLTDGVCEVSPKVKREFLKFKEKTGARLWVLYFGDYSRSLQELADRELLVLLDNAGQAVLDELARDVL